MSFARLPAIALPLVFALALASVAAFPGVSQSAPLVQSILGAAGALMLWTVIVFIVAKARKRTLRVELVLRSQHYVQACTQVVLFLYWGFYWREVYDSALLIVAQLVFAYAFDALLAWSRRDTYTLGFGPFPVVLSINLFLWFKPDWFFLQFLMVGVGFAGKELVTWTKDGKKAHVFNPSSLTLALFSAGLIATGSTRITFGPEVATTMLRAPGIYPFMFGLCLVGQYFFGVTIMTMTAAVTMYALGALHIAWTGAPFFRDELVPIAVFLGMQLLFTDPSTSPRTELGRVLFGVLYAVGVMVTYGVLEATKIPSFYDKLLPVPLMNLTIQLIDRAARSPALARLDPGAIGRSLVGRRRNLVYIGIWTVVFVALSAARPFGPVMVE